MHGNVLNSVKNVREGASILVSDQPTLCAHLATGSSLKQHTFTLLLTVPVQQEHMTSMFYITFALVTSYL